jgi:hypothetical protein
MARSLAVQHGAARASAYRRLVPTFFVFDQPGIVSDMEEADGHPLPLIERQHYQALHIGVSHPYTIQGDGE